MAVAIVFTLWALLQLNLAPVVQERTEYDHSRTVLEDMGAVQTDSVRATSAGLEQGTVIRVGSNYPNYLLLLQPSGPYGTIEMGERRSIALANAEAADPEAADYLDGRTLTYRVQPFRYSPSYHQFEDPPDYVLSGSTLVARYEDRTKVVASPTVVEGRRISLIGSRGEFSLTTTAPTTIHTEPLSGAPATVPVTDDGSSPITIRIPTRLSKARWTELLASEIDADTSAASPSTDHDGRFVAELELDDSTSPNTLAIHLESGVVYQLDAALLGYRTGHQAPFNASAYPGPRYLVADSDRRPVVVEENTAELTVQVRDRYHNPRGNVKVSATVLGDGSLDRIEALTDDEGTVTFEYTAPEIEAPTGSTNAETHSVRVQVSGESGAAYTVVFEVQVQNAYD